LFAISISPIIAVLGPTGAGKSDLGLVLAEASGGEIINCDSVQLYSGLTIGSAKLPVSERRGIPHHLLDAIGPGEELTAGAYARLARLVIAEIGGRGQVPVVVGGTGFYFRALFTGLSPAPERNADLRSRLEAVRKRRPEALHRFIQRFDPEAARRIHPNDHQKLIRAIELIQLAQQPATQTQSTPREAWTEARVLKLGLNPPRAELYARLNRRSVWMFEHGLLEETQALLDSGVSSDAKPLQSLGYRQAVQVLKGCYTIAEAIEECQTKTRQYAKRQMTWFRSEPDMQWLSGFGSEPEIQRTALELCRTLLRISPLETEPGTRVTG
jgi:tRNA dimethylallyltransferase